MPRLFRTILTSLTLGIASCGSLPSPPDQDVSLDTYKSPSALVSADSLSDVWLQTQRTRPLAGTLRSLEVLSELHEKLIEEAKKGTLDLVGSGFANVTRECELGGSLELTAVFGQNLLKATTWGTATNCTEQKDGVTIGMDGELFLQYLSEDSKFRLLFLVDGNLTIDQDDVGRETGTVGLKWHIEIQSDEVRALLDSSDGTILYYRQKDDTEGFIDAEEKWTCDFSQSRCVDSEGFAVSPN